MAKNLFSVPIFFIVFRETLEAAIIVSVLLGLAEQIVNDDPSQVSQITGSATVQTEGEETKSNSEGSATNVAVEDVVQRRRLMRKLRFQVSIFTEKIPYLAHFIDAQIFLGAGCGLFIALAIGAAYVLQAAKS